MGEAFIRFCGSKIISFKVSLFEENARKKSESTEVIFFTDLDSEKQSRSNFENTNVKNVTLGDFPDKIRDPATFSEKSS